MPSTSRGGATRARRTNDALGPALPAVVRRSRCSSLPWISGPPSQKLFGIWRRTRMRPGLAKMRDAKLMIYEGLSQADGVGLGSGPGRGARRRALGIRGGSGEPRPTASCWRCPSRRAGPLCSSSSMARTTPNIWPPTIRISSRSWFVTTLRMRPLIGRCRSSGSRRCRLGRPRPAGGGSSNCSCPRLESSWRRTRISSTSIAKPAQD